MSAARPRFVVGIDLGTSNTVVAASATGEPPTIEPIRQRTAPTTIEKRPLLPSCAYAALGGELPPSPELGEVDGWTLGELARRRGAEVPGRAILSAKSWLCHARVDKEAPILPWGAPDDVPKLSPVEVATRLLSRVRTSWDADHPDAPLTSQDVVLTVPASFDEVARELTVRAATKAGLSVRLLEEPQAAFYAAMGRGALTKLGGMLDSSGAKTLHVLVVDVGGGTTDLSLLSVSRGSRAAAPSVARVAVGPHLLLGGDNMDLALAHALEPSLSGDKLEATRFAELTGACRRAKERLFDRDAPDEVKVTLLGRGADLLGGAKSALLKRTDAEAIVLDGFLPMLSAGAPIPARPRAGLVAMGLPFERETGITRHVAAFLARHSSVSSADSPAGSGPSPRASAILLNGGVFNARAIRDRLVRAIEAWQGAPLEVLDHEDADLAVALGAVAYGRALRGEGPRIEGGAARSFFMGLDKDPGGGRRAVLVVPKGAAEGTRHVLVDRPLALLVGRPARFDLYTSDVASAVEPGEVVAIDDVQFEALPPLSTAVDSDSGERGEVGVVLEAELTPVGTLELACVERAPAQGRAPRRFRLAFDLTNGASAAGPVTSRPAHHGGKSLDQALELVTRVYGKGTSGDPREPKALGRDLDKLLGPRDDWSADVARALADRLLDHVKGRRRTIDHERAWFQLCGFCMRPGFGAPGDAERARALAPLFAERLAFSKEARSWQQLFICFRRVAGGLPEDVQRAMRDELDPFIAPAEAKLKKPKGVRPEGADAELLDLLGHLERVPAARRAELGGWILERTWTRRDPRLWAAIGRIGARAPAYASVHHVVAPNVAERWCDHLLREKWIDLPTAPRAASELARATGDRARDLSDAMRREVTRRLEKEGAIEELVRVVREVTPVREAERATFFGERLPSGLRLMEG